MAKNSTNSVVEDIVDIEAAEEMVYIELKDVLPESNMTLVVENFDEGE